MLREGISRVVEKVLRVEAQYEWMAYVYGLILSALMFFIQVVFKAVERRSGFGISYGMYFRSICCLGLNYSVARTMGVGLWGRSPIFKALLARSLLVTLCPLIYFCSVKTVDLSVVNSIWMLSPVFANFTDLLLYRAAIAPKVFFSSAAGFIGVLVISDPFGGFGTVDREWRAWVLALGAGAFLNALGSSMIRMLKSQYSECQILHYFYSCNLLLTILLLNLQGSTLPDYSRFDLPVAAGFGFCGLASYAAHLCNQRALRLKPASQIQSMQYVSVLLSVCFDYLVAEAQLSPNKFIGLVLICGGTACIICGVK